MFSSYPLSLAIICGVAGSLLFIFFRQIYEKTQAPRYGLLLVGTLLLILSSVIFHGNGMEQYTGIPAKSSDLVAGEIYTTTTNEFGKDIVFLRNHLAITRGFALPKAPTSGYVVCVEKDGEKILLPVNSEEWQRLDKKTD